MSKSKPKADAGFPSPRRAYLVQALSATTGLVELRAVDLSLSHARVHRKMVAEEPRTIRAYIEKSWINHCFGFGMVSQIRSNIVPRKAYDQLKEELERSKGGTVTG